MRVVMFGFQTGVIARSGARRIFYRDGDGMAVVAGADARRAGTKPF
jgi:hypothetical protein